MQHVLRYLEILLFKCKNLNFVKTCVSSPIWKNKYYFFWHSLLWHEKVNKMQTKRTNQKVFLNFAIKFQLYVFFWWRENHCTLQRRQAKCRMNCQIKTNGDHTYLCPAVAQVHYPCSLSHGKIYLCRISKSGRSANNYRKSANLRTQIIC